MDTLKLSRLPFLISMRHSKVGFYETVGKRAFDFLVSSFSIVVLAPVFVSVAAAIKLEDRGPVIFLQERTGRNGGRFSIYKFRSMAVGTPNVPSGEFQTRTVTRVGRLIRRTNIDELPQLYNIVRGDMSVVGPRPPLPAQTDVIEARRSNGALAVLPGLTGWAQINSYDGMAPLEKARMDGEYASALSLRHDLSIIMRTFVYILKPPPKY